MLRLRTSDWLVGREEVWEKEDRVLVNQQYAKNGSSGEGGLEFVFVRHFLSSVFKILDRYT